ncbi:MAG: hypothetical protein HYY37_00785 [Candidatus Aenigmarchaeota archaeon]|nr:hypothetical protein [Candidatus Aenigmarchaeota archaeon]
MAVEASLPAIGTVIISALVDSINPCAIGVMILLVATLVASSAKRERMLAVGGVYVFAVFLAYLLAGVGLMFFFQTIPLIVAEYISIFVASLLTIAGLIEIKDFFWYGRGISLAISPDMAKKIHARLERITLPGVFLLGVFVAGVELPCTGGPYLAVILVLSQNFNAGAMLLLVLYNIIFVLPLAAILAAVLMGTKIHHIKQWKHKFRGYMRLAIGILLIALSWLLILIANGTINFG